MTKVNFNANHVSVGSCGTGGNILRAFRVRMSETRYGGGGRYKLTCIKGLLTVVLLLWSCAVAVSADIAASYDFKVDGIYYKITENGINPTVEVGHAVISSNSGPYYNASNYTGNITIPSTVTYKNVTYAVTGIGNNSFAYSEITGIVLPERLVYIGSSAFRECRNLTNIIIPESVTSIGTCAFEYSSSLTSVIIPYSVTSIAAYTFEDCESLAEVTIPSSVTSIGDYAFYDCESLSSVIIPSSVTEIGDHAFCACNGLTSVVSLNTSAPTCATNERGKDYVFDFDGVDTSCLLCVPQNSTGYRTDRGWTDFTRYLEFSLDYGSDIDVTSWDSGDNKELLFADADGKIIPGGSEITVKKASVDPVSGAVKQELNIYVLNTTDYNTGAGIDWSATKVDNAEIGCNFFSFSGAESTTTTGEYSNHEKGLVKPGEMKKVIVTCQPGTYGTRTAKCRLREYRAEPLSVAYPTAAGVPYYYYYLIEDDGSNCWGPVVTVNFVYSSTSFDETEDYVVENNESVDESGNGNESENGNGNESENEGGNGNGEENENGNGDGTEGIKNVTTDAATAGSLYNLAGQRVREDTKGLLIRNGKKVLIK